MQRPTAHDVTENKYTINHGKKHQASTQRAKLPTPPTIAKRIRLAQHAPRNTMNQKPHHRQQDGKYFNQPTSVGKSQ
jgi:hypothetical protein